jgi:hypothetical protein
LPAAGPHDERRHDLIAVNGVAGELNGDAAMATLDSPFRPIADGIGNLYVTELSRFTGYGSHTIRRIDLSGPSVTTFARAPGRSGRSPHRCRRRSI